MTVVTRRRCNTAVPQPPRAVAPI